MNRPNYKRVAAGITEALDENLFEPIARPGAFLIRALALHAPELLESFSSLKERHEPREAEKLWYEKTGLSKTKIRGEFATFVSNTPKSEKKHFTFRARHNGESVSDYEQEISKAFRNWRGKTTEIERSNLVREKRENGAYLENRRAAEWFVLWQYKGWSDAEIVDWEVKTNNLLDLVPSTVGKGRRRFAKAIGAQLRAPNRVGRPTKSTK